MPRKARINRRARRRRATVISYAGSFVKGIRRATPWVLLASIVIGLPVAAYVGWEKALRADFFHVTGVDLEGATHTQISDVERVIGITGPDVNIFTIDPEYGRKRVEQLPWVKRASVNRVLPDRIRVSLVERVAAGVVMRDGLWLMEEDGSVFATMEQAPALDLPIISIPGAIRGSEQTEDEKRRIREALRIAALYQKLGLDSWTRLAEVEIDPVTGYALVTEERRLRVLLGDGRMEARLGRLEHVYQALEREKVAGARVIRLDGDGALRHVAVRTDRPGIGQ